MNGVRTRQFRHAEDFIDGEVGLDRPQLFVQMGAPADLVGFVRLEPVQRQLVFLRPDSDRLDAEFIGCTEHPDGDFRAVGDEYLADQIMLLN